MTQKPEGRPLCYTHLKTQMKCVRRVKEWKRTAKDSGSGTETRMRINPTKCREERRREQHTQYIEYNPVYSFVTLRVYTNVTRV